MKNFHLLLFALLLLPGCSQAAWFDRFVPEVEKEFAINFLTMFQEGDFDTIEETLDPGLYDAQLRSKLENIASYFPAEDPTSIQVVGVQTVTGAQEKRINLTFQYEYPDRWLLANVVLLETGGEVTVLGVNVRPIQDSLENMNRFTPTGKSALHYFVLAAAIIIPIFILATLWLCIRTPIPRRKWLWIVFILFGFAQLTLNWSDGSNSFALLSIQFLGVSIWKGGLFAPWQIAVSLPLGAVVFFLRRKRWSTPASQPEVIEASTKPDRSFPSE